MADYLSDADVQDIRDRWSDAAYDGNHEVAKRDVLRLLAEVERTRQPVAVPSEEG